MKLSRLTPVVFIVWLVFYMFGNNMLPVTDPVESNYALTAKEMVLSGDWLRSEERRVGKECRIGCRSRWSPYH